jgi:hypothetical protein
VLVDRCVCRDKTFAALRQLSQAEGLDRAGIAERTGCSTVCTLCAPYIELMLRTGETAFRWDDPRLHAVRLAIEGERGRG